MSRTREPLGWIPERAARRQLLFKDHRQTRAGDRAAGGGTRVRTVQCGVEHRANDRRGAVRRGRMLIDCIPAGPVTSTCPASIPSARARRLPPVTTDTPEPSWRSRSHKSRMIFLETDRRAAASSASTGPTVHSTYLVAAGGPQAEPVWARLSFLRRGWLMPSVAVLSEPSADFGEFRNSVGRTLDGTWV